MIPAGDDVTTPMPVPLRVTTRLWLWPNAALTWRSASTVITHAPVPVHAPLQPRNVEPGPATGVSVSWVPWSTVAAQVPGQSMPAGADVTWPLPLPAVNLEPPSNRWLQPVDTTVLPARRCGGGRWWPTRRMALEHSDGTTAEVVAVMMEPETVTRNGRVFTIWVEAIAEVAEVAPGIWD